MPTPDQFDRWAGMDDHELDLELRRAIHRGTGETNGERVSNHFGVTVEFPRGSEMAVLRENVRAALTWRFITERCDRWPAVAERA